MKTTKKSGMALPLVMVFMIVCAMVAASFFTYTHNVRKWSARDVYREQAFALAEAGVELAAQNLLTNWAVPASGYVYNQPATALGAGTFAYTISSLTNNYVYAISATGTVGKLKRAVHIARAERPAWAKFAFWTDVNGVIYFFGNESFTGPVHSNDDFWFSPSGGPGVKFFDSLTSAASNYNGDITGAYFAKGFQLSTPQGSMADVNFTNLLTTAQSIGLVLTGVTAITFSGTNTFITNPQRKWTNYNYRIPGDNVIYVANRPGSAAATNQGTVQIGGKIDGRVTVVTDDSFWITNHLTYAVNPTNNPSSDDVLGLVAAGDVIIRTNAPNNLDLYAAIMATGQNPNYPGSITVQNYSTRAPSGDLKSWGSLVQLNRGIVNTGGGGTSGTGFAKRYGFDTRLSLNAPRYYPRMATSVLLSGWSEEGAQ